MSFITKSRLFYWWSPVLYFEFSQYDFFLDFKIISIPNLIPYVSTLSKVTPIVDKDLKYFFIYTSTLYVFLGWCLLNWWIKVIRMQVSLFLLFIILGYCWLWQNVILVGIFFRISIVRRISWILGVFSRVRCVCAWR